MEFGPRRERIDDNPSRVGDVASIHVETSREMIDRRREWRDRTAYAKRIFDAITVGAQMIPLTADQRLTLRAKSMSLGDGRTLARTG